jgi:hypothetical protein
MHVQISFKYEYIVVLAEITKTIAELTDHVKISTRKEKRQGYL